MRYVEDHNRDHMCKLSIAGTGKPIDELSSEELHELVFEVSKEEKAQYTSVVSPLLEETIDVLGLPSRAVNALYEADVVHVKELVAMTEAELSKLHYLGKNTISAVKKTLAQKGLQLKISK